MLRHTSSEFAGVTVGEEQVERGLSPVVGQSSRMRDPLMSWELGMKDHLNLPEFYCQFSTEAAWEEIIVK